MPSTAASPKSATALPRDVANAAKDLVYVTVGFGVLAVQRAQAQRRELQEKLNGQLGAGKSGIEKATAAFEQQVKALEARLAAVEERIDATLDQVEAKMPEQARAAFHQAREAARTARDQVRKLTTRAA
jgi:cob(I)alamin adenosyltransferase